MHARRYYVQALESGDLRAALPVELIGLLYKVEELAKLQGLDVEQRQALRQQKSARVLDRLFSWLHTAKAGAEPKTPFGKAVTYLTNQWSSLIVYVTDGAIPIDNGEVERQIRPIARGRKAYLFAGSDEGGRRCAVLYTMMANCRIAKVAPEAWLTDVMDKLSRGWKQRDLAEFLPQNWSAPQTTEQAAATSAPEPLDESSDHQIQAEAG